MGGLSVKTLEDLLAKARAGGYAVPAAVSTPKVLKADFQNLLKEERSLEAPEKAADAQEALSGRLPLVSSKVGNTPSLRFA